DAAAGDERAAVSLGHECGRRVAPGRVLVPVELVEVRQENLAPARVHQRMIPRQYEDARRRGTRGRVLDDQHAQRLLASRLDGAVELGRQLAWKLLARGDGDATERRALERLARSG